MTKLTPQHLKSFRRYYSITQAQAAHLFGTTRAQWWRWEQEIDLLPGTMHLQLRKHAKKLNTALAHRAKYCHLCGRKVERAKRNGWNACPYCSTQFSRAMRYRILEVLPKKKLPRRRINNGRAGDDT